MDIGLQRRVGDELQQVWQRSVERRVEKLLKRLFNHSQSFVTFVIPEPIMIFVEKRVEQLCFIFEDFNIFFAFNLGRFNLSSRFDDDFQSFCSDVRT